MNLLAAWLSATFAALLVGTVSGAWPVARTRRRRRPSTRHDASLQAGLHLRPFQFDLLLVAVVAGTFFLVWMLSSIWTIAVPPALAVALIPRALVARRRSQRIMEMQRAWPDGLRDLIASISSGMSLGRGLERLARHGPQPLRDVLAPYPQLARAVGVAGALEAIKAQQAHPSTDRIFEVLILANERGGALVVDILRDLATATTRDVWAVEEIETLALEQKINARIVFAVPWLVLVFMTLRPGPFRDFYGSVAGALVVAVGGMASLLGMWLVGRLGREPEEPRVFGSTG